MLAYYYISTLNKEDSLNCGIKLSVNADRNVPINGYMTPCISTLLNPKDDLTNYKTSNFICLRIEIKDEYCFIANKELYGNKNTIDLYNQSIVAPKDYIFGTYRIPECLITCTILPENISEKNKIMDFPILYDNSENLYINNLIYDMREKYKYYDEISLKLFLDKLESQGQFKKIENEDSIIYSNQAGEIYTIKVREF